jgi:Tfp pilus assembly protein PilF/SAM-dependent methyltransferase
MTISADMLSATLQQAVAYLHAGRLAETEDLCRKSLVTHGADACAFNLLGLVALRQSRDDEAAHMFVRAITLEGGVADFHFNLGTVLSRMRHLDRAIPHFWQALTLDPSLVAAHFNLGVTLQEQGRPDDAALCFRRALVLFPDYSEALNNFGATCRDQNKLAEAALWYRRAIAIAPDFGMAQRNLGKVKHAMAAYRSLDALRDKIAAGLGDGLEGVRQQYELLPFPARDPAAEDDLLFISVPDILPKVNQYCFGGARDFAKGVRVLIAGAGTGDSVIWLAHQLRDTPSEIVALDFSSASLAIAKARAERRGFANICWVHAPLLDVATLELGSFDYVTCLGVLHHLADPEAGIAALASVLAENGGMVVMLYGVHGRVHIYQMQAVLRDLTIGLNSPADKLALARLVLADLPPTNSFLLRESAKGVRREYLENAINLWDTLLHEQDRAYTASEVRALIAGAGLTVQSFATYRGVEACTALQYDLDLYVRDPAQQARLAALPRDKREDLAETLDGTLALHTVYATHRPDAALNPLAPHAILSVFSERARQLLGQVASGQPITIQLNNGYVLRYSPSLSTRAFLAAIDGRQSNAEILTALGVTDLSAALVMLAVEMRLPCALHWLTARTAEGTPWPPLPVLGSVLTQPVRHEEPNSMIKAEWTAFAVRR